MLSDLVRLSIRKFVVDYSADWASKSLQAGRPVEAELSRSYPTSLMPAAFVTGHSTASARETAVPPRPGARRFVASLDTATKQPATSELLPAVGDFHE